MVVCPQDMGKVSSWRELSFEPWISSGGGGGGGGGKELWPIVKKKISIKWCLPCS